MAGIKHTFSVNIADDASAIAAGEVLPSHWNAEHTLSDVASNASLQGLVSSLSALSVKTSAAGASVHGLQSILDAISNRISIEAPVGGGGGSVTSQEVSIVSAQAASAISQEASLRSAGDATLSVRTDSVANAVSIVSNAASNALSVANAASNAASIVSAELQSVRSVLSQRISALSLNALANLSIVSPVDGNALMYNSATGEWHNSTPPAGGASVTSTEVSAVSAQAASAINVVSNAVSIVSTAASNALSVANAASNKASAISAGLASLSIRSAGVSVKGLQSVLNVISNQFSNSFSAGDVLSANFVSVQSTVSHLASIVSNVSAVSGAGSATGLQNVINALSNRISAGGGGSVTSNEASAISAQAASAISQQASIRSAADASIWSAVSVLRSALSVKTSAAGTSVRGMQSIIDAISNRISIEAPVGGGGGSVTSTELSAVSAQGASALSAALNVSIRSAVGSGSTVSVKGLQSILNAISNTFSNSFSAGNVVSANVVSLQSTVSHLASIVSLASVRSVGNVSTKGLQSVLNALSQRISVAAGGSASPTSNEYSVLSNTVSVHSNQISALSQALSVVSNAASNALSVANAASNAASIVSANLASVNSDVRSVVSHLQSVLSQRISAISVDALKDVSISAVASAQVLKWNSAAAQWLNLADATGGGGSVTSTEVSAVSAQAASALSQALSVLSVTDAALSTRVDSVANAVSVVSNAVSVVSNAVSIVSTAASNALSVANAASNAASIVSVALLSEISNRTSADNAVSAQAASAISQLQSVLSQRISALSLNALANLSIASPVDGNALMYNSATGEWHNSTPPGGGGGSVTSTEVSAVSAQAASALSAGLNVSILSVVGGGGASATSIHGLQSILNAISNTLSNSFSAGNVVSAQLASVKSNHDSAISDIRSVISAVSVQAASAISAVSAQAASAISQLNSVVSQLNSIVSVEVNRHQRRVYGNGGASITVSAATLTNLPSMSISMAASAVYEINGWVAFEALTSGGFLFGFSAPALGPLGANFRGQMLSLGSGAVGGAHSAGVVAMSAVAAGQTVLCSASIATINSRRWVNIEGMLQASIAGTFQLMARTSVAGAGILIKGAYLHAFRITD